jgi:sorting nexin-25
VPYQLHVSHHLLVRKLRESVTALFTESRLMSYINAFRDGLWPGGSLKPPGIPRTAEEKLRTRDDANRKLSALIPGMTTDSQ